MDQLLNESEAQYLNLLQDVLDNGVVSEDRTGVGTISSFGKRMEFDLSKGFPLITTKKLHWKSIVIELLWMMQGTTNTKWLNTHGVTIWDEWSDEQGNLGPVYGAQWRNWETKYDNGYQYDQDSDFYGTLTIEFEDQLTKVISNIKTDPNSRRHIVSAWNVGELDQMALQPCHVMFQFYVRNGKLDCQLYQRSGDLFLGIPYNIASYSLLTHLIANECGLEVGKFIHVIGDAHIYSNHVEQVKLQLSRIPKHLAKLNINIPSGELMNFIDVDLDKMEWSDIKKRIKLSGYESHDKIEAEVAI